MPTTFKFLTVPSDGDPANAESVNAAFRALLSVCDASAALGRFSDESDAAATSGGDDIYAAAWGRLVSGAERGYCVVVGAQGTLMHAINGGSSFTLLAAASSYIGTFYDVIHLGVDQGFLACGAVGEVQSIQTAGFTVTRRKNGGQDLLCAAIKPSNGRIVVAGTNGAIFTADLSDLGTWTARTPGSSYAGHFRACIYDDRLGLFVLVGDAGEIQTSTNGVTWTRRRTGSENFYSVARTSTALVAAGYDVTGVVRSTDALTWTDVNGVALRTGKVRAVGEAFVLFDWQDEEAGFRVSGDGGRTWALRRQTQAYNRANGAWDRNPLWDGRRFHLVDDAGNTYPSAHLPGAF